MNTLVFCLGAILLLAGFVQAEENVNKSSILISHILHGSGHHSTHHNHEHPTHHHEEHYVPSLASFIKGSIYKKKITMSGMSFGGTFAQQMHLTHSNCLSGIGILASFFYKCGDESSNFLEVYSKCGVKGGYPTPGLQSQPEEADLKGAIRSLKKYEKDGLIEPLSNLLTQKVFLYQGSVDQFIPPSMPMGIVTLYGPYISSPANIMSVLMYARHVYPTVSKGVPCAEDVTESPDPRIGKCNYYTAFQMFYFLLSDSTYKVTWPRDVELEELHEFDQKEFTEGIDGFVGLDKIGYVYVPSQCQSDSSTCYLHFYFHPCFDSRDWVGTLHIQGTGLLEVAEANGIIIVFPQVKKSKVNPESCFDGYGYTGSDYANKKGVQIQAVKNMLSVFLDL